MEIGKTIQPCDREEWRRWLIEGHAKEDEIWVIFFKKRTGRGGLQYGEAVEEAICFGWIDGILKRLDDERHVIRFSPRRKGSIWSDSNRSRALRMISSGRMTGAGMEKIPDDVRSGKWKPVKKRHGIEELPDYIREGIESNEGARDFYESLPPSHREQYIYWITSAKRDETRRRRLARAVEMLGEGRKPG